MKNIAENIKELRKERDISQAFLAKEINMDRSTVSRLESGKVEPSLEQLELLSSFYNVPISYFFDDHHYDKKLVDKNEEIHKIIAVLFGLLLCLLINPFGFILCGFLIFYIYRNKMPRYVKIAAFCMMLYCIGGILHIFGIYIFPAIITVR